ncbi:MULTISPECIES: PLD nuclease N-terminal domain-containing protein [unclassified Pseudarthrobacter]|uniref:PLD nuclease N-terminal domain-containing protein n=1 Tax=unclassified Pseudarthrobacter TaxID=2647000 RepID=UPI0030775371
MLFRVVLAVAVLAIFVYGLVDVIRTDGRLTRGISKPAWIVVMIVLPVLGAILWLLIGRPRGNPPVRQSYSHPTAPDDDPDFLRNLEVRRRNQAEAARLKKLKDDLEAKGQADGGASAAGPDTGGHGPTGTGTVNGGAGDASSGDADTHDTDDRK